MQVHTEMLIAIMACLDLSGLLHGVGFLREVPLMAVCYMTTIDIL
jgi:hypothetical protein